MLNLAIGSAREVDGRTCIETGSTSGHATYGPYEMLDAGRYAVTFHLSPVVLPSMRGGQLCAVIDVATDFGRTALAKRKLSYADLADGTTEFTLTFMIAQPARVEYRTWVSGKVPLMIDDYCRAVPLPADGDDIAAIVAQSGFPADDDTAPEFFRENLAMFRSYYERGMGVAMIDGGVVLTVAGVSMHTRTRDDLAFIGEVFDEHAYNVGADRPLAVIDVGMNIGLTSLMLATKPEVVEVHAYEPFVDTFERAMDNLRLNPALAAKISAHNYGLSDKDWDGPMIVDAGETSGARATIAVPGGRPVHLTLRAAGETLAPIIGQARAKGLGIVVKLDCEGSEFPILASLVEADLVRQVDAFMVEWHAMFPERGREFLLAPLRAAGFLVFDRSPPVGNGFFYAVRAAIA